MNFRFLFILILLYFYSNSICGNNADTTHINKNRVFLVSSSMALSMGASYLYIKNAWWNDVSRDFHFDPGNDLVYALNVDKAAHFLGGAYSSDLFSTSFKWAGLKDKKSIWYGALFGTGIQMAIELKDAYAPYWGFSKWDLAIGSAGSFWPVAQYYSKSANAINFKFSYFKRSDIYWQLDSQRGKDTYKFSWQDDYPNQTYWVSFDVNHFIDTDVIPPWLDLAVGFGLDDTQYLDGGTKMGGNPEYYIALDYDIMEILKKWDSSFAKKVKFMLKYIKLPAPTIRFSPELKVYPFFM